MKSFLRGIVLNLTVYYIAMIYKSAGLARLGFMLTGIIITALIYLSINSRKLRFSMDIPISLAEQGQDVTVRIWVEKLGMFYPQKMMFKMELGNFFGKEKYHAWLRTSRGASDYKRYSEREHSYDYSVKMYGAGNYEIQFMKIRIYDMLGFFYVTRKCRCFRNIQVLPQIHEVPVILGHGVRNFYGDADDYDDLRPGYDVSETLRIREFQNGDKVESIHWKLSAKQDQLMVKESSMPKACPIVFILDTSDKGARNRKVRSSTNRFLQIVASISFAIMDSGCPHYVAWYSEARQEIVQIRVDSEDSFYLFLNYMLADRISEKVEGMQEMFEEKFRNQNLVHRIRLDRNLKIYKDDELWIEYAGRDIQNELSQTEIYL